MPALVSLRDKTLLCVVFIAISAFPVLAQDVTTRAQVTVTDDQDKNKTYTGTPVLWREPTDIGVRNGPGIVEQGDIREILRSAWKMIGAAGRHREPLGPQQLVAVHRDERVAVVRRRDRQRDGLVALDRSAGDGV